MSLEIEFGSSEKTFSVGFDTEEKSDVGFETSVPVIQDANPYTGDYEVTPDVEAQVLKTKEKVMRKDITVKEIPVYEVSNAAGGETVIIGGNIKNYG